MRYSGPPGSLRPSAAKAAGSADRPYQNLLAAIAAGSPAHCCRCGAEASVCDKASVLPAALDSRAGAPAPVPGRAILAWTAASAVFVSVSEPGLGISSGGMSRRAVGCNGYTLCHLPAWDSKPLPRKEPASFAIFAARMARSRRLMRSLLKYGPSAFSSAC